MKNEAGQCPQPEKVVEFKEFKRTAIAEMRFVNEVDIENFKNGNGIIVVFGENPIMVSISDADKNNGSPKIGDMIARNPKNHDDQWLIAEKYSSDNFECTDSGDFISLMQKDEAELNSKIERLYDFTQSHSMDTLKSTNKTILLTQLDAMRIYWKCLTEWINISTTMKNPKQFERP